MSQENGIRRSIATPFSFAPFSLRNSPLRKVIVPTACLFLSAGCATIVSGTTQEIALTTPGAEGAQCSLTSPDGSYSVVTPGAVTVGRSKHDIKVRCVKPGFSDGTAVIVSTAEGWTAGNIVVGGPVGLITDSATGAQNEYPKKLKVAMRKI